ncbi:hypothetical protein ASZ78_013815 [Callipepla squamata]|uniref:Uncharacterized protein n=1 Tax=Callipepla squamata TaxID=9009 RepID=A0A226MA74_CALSU|nr:hypothetical protein ASZ78_013815 [Callipepla squamata]
MQQKLPGWDTSLANSVSVPQGPSAINTTQGNLGIRSVTSRDEGQIPVPGYSRTMDVGVQVEPQELEENAVIEQAGHPSDALQLPSLALSTIVSESYRQDLAARDTSVTAENVSLLTYVCPESVESEEEEGQDEFEADAAEAGSVPPSGSGSSPGEVKSTPSTSPVADGPRAEGHLPTCEEGAEAAACQQEVSQVPATGTGCEIGQRQEWCRIVHCGEMPGAV